MNKTLKKILKPILGRPYRWLRKDRLWIRKLLSVISPTYASKRLYKRALGKRLNLKNPKTLNEKVMWLKLNTYYNNPLITECVDKYLVRNYIKRAGCEEILNELLGVWDSPEEINFDALPEQFVLKCNHGCGYNLIVKDKSKLNIPEAKEQLKKWLKEDYWKLYGETQYKFIHKKIIAEKFIQTKDDALPVDYKFFCVNGKPECAYVATERNFDGGGAKRHFFDREMNYYSDVISVDRSNFEDCITVPGNIDQMFTIAEKLSKSFPFVRVDLYNEKGKIVFGELTFVPDGAIYDGIYANKPSKIQFTPVVDIYAK